MIGAFSKRGVEPFYQWRNNYGEPWRRLLSSEDWWRAKKLSAIWRTLFVAICVPAENGLRVQGELSRRLVQVVRLVESGNLQFLFPRVALPSKLFARATWGPIKGGLQSFCHDPTWSTQRELLHTSRSVIFTYVTCCSECARACAPMLKKYFSLLLIIRVNEIHYPMHLTNNV